MRQQLLITVSIILFIVPLWTLAPINEWEESNLKFSDLLVRSKICTLQNTEQKTGCLAALNAILHKAKKAPVTNLETISFENAIKLLPQNMEATATAAALNAWLKTQDPHAQIQVASSAERMAKNQTDRYPGIGASLLEWQGHILFSVVEAKGPAEIAGIQVGDTLLAVNDSSVLSLGIEDILKKMQGNAGSKINLTIKRTNSANEIGVQKRLSITRAQLELPNVESQLMNGSGYIKIRSFDKRKTCEMLAKKIFELESHGANKIILDLRNNPGGFVHEATCVSSLFLGPNMKIADFIRISESQNLFRTQRTPKKNFNEFTMDPASTYLPLTILINSNSASAAEIVSEALQYYKRATIIGDHSFGKGTMQSVSALAENTEILLSRTTHEVLSPSGESIRYRGVWPDILVENNLPSLPREVNRYGNSDLEKIFQREWDAKRSTQKTLRCNGNDPTLTAALQIENCS